MDISKFVDRGKAVGKRTSQADVSSTPLLRFYRSRYALPLTTTLSTKTGTNRMIHPMSLHKLQYFMSQSSSTLLVGMQSRHEDCKRHCCTSCLEDCDLKFLPSIPSHLGSVVPTISVPTLVAFFWAALATKTSERFSKRPTVPISFQKHGTNPTRPYCTPITTYIQKLPPVRRGYRSLFLCSMLRTCATCDVSAQNLIWTVWKVFAGLLIPTLGRGRNNVLCVRSTQGLRLGVGLRCARSYECPKFFDLRVHFCVCRACRASLTAQSLVLCCQLGHSASTLCVLVRQLHVGRVFALLNTIRLHNLVPKGLVVRLSPSQLCLRALGLHHSGHSQLACLISGMETASVNLSTRASMSWEPLAKAAILPLPLHLRFTTSFFGLFSLCSSCS